jgi:putative ABC transport system permease protein
VLKLTIRNLIDKKIRLALTTLAVVLGVTFVVGVFVLTDSLRSTFGDLAEEIADGTDLTVRSPQDLGDDFDRTPVPETLGDTIAGVDGVDSVFPGVWAPNVAIIDGNGDAIEPQGPPQLGFNFSGANFYIVDGRAPAASGEVVIDTTTVDDSDLVVGQTYSISGPSRQESFELVGTFNFGAPDSNTSVGQTMAAFDLETAQRFLDFEGSYLEIGVRVDDGADRAEVRAAIESAVGTDYEVITQEVSAQENEDEFDEFIDVFNNILLAFAIVAVFVSAFIINNTFQIVLGQRIRELGLLRAVGASGRQVSRSVVLESGLVGVFSTVIGIGLGVLVGILLEVMLNSAGFALPDGPVELRPRTIVAAIVVGMGVTMVSSIAPARRARRIPPIAALRDGYHVDAAGLSRRVKVGGTVTVLGAVLLGLGLFGDLDTAPLLTLISLGGLMVFVGVNVLSPVFARQAARAIGQPISKAFGIPGRLARENSARTPRRTASTAGALMIGLALVAMAAVVGESIKSSFLDTLDNAVEADYFVRSNRGNFDPTAGFPAQVQDELEALDLIDSTVGYRFAQDAVRVNGSTKNLFSTEFAKVTDHLDADVVAGSIESADPLTSILLHEDPASDLGVEVGDTIEVTFPDNQTPELTVAAIYSDSTILDNWVIDLALWDEHFNRDDLAFVSATISGFSDDLPEQDRQTLLDESGAEVDSVLENYPGVTGENRADFRQSQEDQLDSFLATIQVFLALALVLALVGIANTLALSVFERTREIGLLRAVGMSRRQLRRAVRWEAAIVAVFGALLGIVLGVVFGIAATVAIPDAIVDQISIPVFTLIVYVVVAGVAGIVAAILPARRAGRMDVLEAIAHE